MAEIHLNNVAPKDTADAHYANTTDAHDLVNRLSAKQDAGAAAGGELSGTYPNPTLLNSAVIAKLLTGLNVTGSSIASTDTILQAFGKIQNQINGVLGGAIYQGVWNATTNSPTLADGTGTKGHYYVVSVAGTQDLGSGNIDFAVGDWVIHNGTIYQKVDNTDAVSSVNGFVGAVNLTTDDISEAANLYYTDARVLALVLTGFAAGSNFTILATDTIAQALAKIQGQINARATLSSPSLTGTPTAPTAAVGNNSTQLATTEFVQSALNTPLVHSATASNSPTIDIPLSDAYNSYILIVTNLIPQTDATTLNFRTSTNGGSSFDSTAGDYRHARFLIIDTPATAAAGSTSATEIPIAANLGTGAGENFSGTFKFYNPSAALAFCMDFDITYLTAAPVYIRTSGGGTRVAAANVDYVRFYMSSGNIASGEFRLYGIKNA